MVAKNLPARTFVQRKHSRRGGKLDLPSRVGRSTCWGRWPCFWGCCSGGLGAVASRLPPLPNPSPPHRICREEITADLLPEDGWLGWRGDDGTRRFASGPPRLLPRGLAHLGGRELIIIARHKSNRDYDQELRRRARTQAGLPEAFAATILEFERAGTATSSSGRCNTRRLHPKSGENPRMLRKPLLALLLAMVLGAGFACGLAHLFALRFSSGDVYPPVFDTVDRSARRGGPLRGSAGVARSRGAPQLQAAAQAAATWWSDPVLCRLAAPRGMGAGGTGRFRCLGGDRFAGRLHLLPRGSPSLGA